MGRPKWEPPTDLQAVEDHAEKYGYLNVMAMAWGISYETLNERLKEEEYSHFRQAIKRGQAKLCKVALNSLQVAAAKGEVAASIFLLKSLGKASDKVPEETPPATTHRIDVHYHLPDGTVTNSPNHIEQDAPIDV